MPGKFEGERPQVEEAYNIDLDGFSESFGDVDRAGYYFAANMDDGETVYCVIDSQGFVSEISAEDYESARCEHLDEDYDLD